jgi:O-antigen/teichoic acid export membrane protein
VTSTVVDLYEFDLRPKALLHRFAWWTFGFGIVRAKGLVTLPLALWILGAEGYGQVSAAIAASAPIALLAFLNIPDGAGRLIVSAPSVEIAEARVAAIRRAGLAVSFLILAAGLLTAAAFSSFVVAWAAALAAVGTLFQVGSIHLQYFQRMKTLVKFQVAGEYIAAFTGLALAVALGAAGMLAGSIAVAAVMALIVWRTLHVPATVGMPSEPFWKPALQLALPLLPVSISLWALFSVDLLIVYALLGKGLTGAYSAAYSIASAALFLPFGINAFWFPTSQRLRAQSVARLRRVTIRLAQLTIAGGIVLTVATVFVAPLLRHLLEAKVYADVPGCVVWIVAGFSALALAKLLEGVVYAAGRPMPILGAYCAGAAVNIALNVWWIPEYGILGAARATFVGFALTALLLVKPAFTELRRP